MAKIDNRFQNARFDTYQPKNLQQRSGLSAMVGNCSGSYFITGPYRAGKTHLLVAQYRACIGGEKHLELISSRDLMEEFRRHEFGEDAPLVIKADEAASFHLFWDDVDKVRLTDFRREMIFDLVDTIYRRQQSLSLTSNLPLEELLNQDVIPPSAIRRIKDICEVIEL